MVSCGRINRRRSRKWLWAAYAVVSLLVAALMASSIVRSLQEGADASASSGRPEYLLPVVVNIVPWFCVFALLPFIFVLRRPFFVFLVQRHMKNNPSMARKRTIEFATDCVRNHDDLTDFIVQWPAFRYFTEDPNLFILFSGRNTILPVPKRAFASEAGIEAFRALLLSKLPAA